MSESGPRRVVVVGGVAGGASTAARLRRMCESCEIVMFDRGPHVSFANCGLPYYVGDVIPSEDELLLATPELFRDKYRIDVQLRCEVVSIDREAREVEVHALLTGRRWREPYDALVLSPGAAPVQLKLPGIDSPGIFTLRNIPDGKKIRDWIATHDATRAVVVGAGFIGVEMAENLRHRGLDVTLVELAGQVMPALDPEMSVGLQAALEESGVTLLLGDAAQSFEPREVGVTVKTRAGRSLEADLVVMSIGVRPETALARDAGLELGETGAIQVDAHQRTSDPRIWAVGDATESRCVLGSGALHMPLAGPANRQGRVAADSIAGRSRTFRGVQGTAVCGACGSVAAMTGLTEKRLKRAGRDDFACVYLHPGHHVGYYPGARKIHLKLIFERESGAVLGAQAFGEEGVVRRIDVVATAIQHGATVFDLEEAELCYAPQYGAAKDPVNLAGMIAANVVRGDLKLAPWRGVEATEALVLDVRPPREFAAGHVPGARNIPLAELRDRLDELPRDRPIWACCNVGKQAYNAARALTQHGLDASNLPGGMATYRDFHACGLLPAPALGEP